MRAKLDSPRMASGRQIAACLILVLIALSIAACGKDSPQGPKIPASRADDLITKLNEVKERAADPNKVCGTSSDSNSAQTSLAAVQDSVDELSGDNVDPQIISNLQELIDNVDQKLADQCSEAATEPTSTETETTSTTTTESTKETTDKSTTQSTEPTTSTTSSTPTTTEPDLTTTQPESPSPPAHSNAGGNGNGQGEGGFEVGGTPPGKRVPANGGAR
jgi:hypothetical protein